MKRVHIILTGVLIVQIALGAFVYWPRSRAQGAGELVFPDLSVDNVVSLTITDDVGKSIALQKVGDAWVLPEVDNYPVLSDSVNSILEKLIGLDTGRLVTRTGASHQPLKVADDDFVRKIDVETVDGQSYVLFLGTSPSYGAAHFRVAGQDEAYLTSKLSAWDVSTVSSSWVDTGYLSRSSDSLTKITLDNANGSFVFTKDPEGNWVLAGVDSGQELNTAAVSNFVSQATNVTLQEPLGKEEQASYGLSEPLAVLTLEGNGDSVTLNVGALHPSDGSFVAKSSDSEYYVRLTQYAVSPLVDTTLQGFLALPATPAAGQE